jgi:hypothetical protein
MFPMLEMAGPMHIRFVSEVLYIYNYASSYEHNANSEGLIAEQRASHEIRRRKSYDRLKDL